MPPTTVSAWENSRMLKVRQIFPISIASLNQLWNNDERSKPLREVKIQGDH